MGLSSTGIGSNMDIESIISQLMAVEKRPLTALAKKEASYQTKLTGFGSLKGALSQFQSAVQGLSDISKFQVVRAGIADSAVASVSASSSAKPGTYSLEVTKLAQSQKLVAAGQASDTAAIGNGVITFDFGTIKMDEAEGDSFSQATGKYTGADFVSSGSGAKTVTIDASNNSLAGIRDAINKANIGVTASIVNDGGASPYRLALSVSNPGAANSLKISVDAPGPLATLLAHDPAGTQNLSETVTAQNAEFKIDGIAISKTSNTVSDAIAGVTINLAKTNNGSKTNITVSRDTASVTTSVNAFVSAYNSIKSTLKNLTAYDAKTKSAAVLNGEASVRSIQSQIQAVLSAPVAGGASAFTLLSEVGVALQKDGTLAVDSAKLQKALDNNFDDIAGLFAATGKASDSLISYSSATAKTKPGSYAVSVSKLATQGHSVGKVVSDFDITSGNDTLQVKLDGVTATVTLTKKTYSSAELAAEIQSKINGAADFVKAGSSVKVTEAGGVFTITSSRYGSASNVSILGGTAQDNIGFDNLPEESIKSGVDVTGTINGVAASGSGQYLTGAIGNDSEGLKILIPGGAAGEGVSRGTINYSHGYAYQLDKLMESLLDEEGPIASRTDGINESLKKIAKDEERISTRLLDTEKRYRAQFNALDLLLSKMNSTSSFLTQQLAGLASSSNS